MKFSLNQVLLMGKLGKDAETSFTQSNVSVTKFSLATEHSYKDKDDNYQSKTTWHNITAFNLNDYLKDQLKKGRQFVIQGRIENGSYEKDGITRYTSEVISDFDGISPTATSNGGTKAPDAANTTAPDASSSSSENDDLPF